MIVVEFTALVGQYFCMEMVSVVLNGIMIGAVTVTIILAEDEEAVVGLAVMEHSMAPSVMGMPLNPKLVRNEKMTELVVESENVPDIAEVVPAYMGFII